MQLIKRPDIWAVVISLVSLFVSLGSLNYSRKQSDLSGGQVRANVQVVDASLVEPITDASFIKIKLRVKNYGQTSAINVSGDMGYEVGVPRANTASRIDFGNMAPAYEQTVILVSNRINSREWPNPSPKGLNTVYFYGTVWFTDETTNKKLKSDWCFGRPLKKDSDLKRLDLEHPGILSYTSE